MKKIKMDDILDGKYDEDVVNKQKLHQFVEELKCFNHHSKKTKKALLDYISKNWDRVYVKSLSDEEMVLVIK